MPPEEGSGAPQAVYFAPLDGGIVRSMPHVLSAFAQHTTSERIAQAEQRRLLRSLRRVRLDRNAA